LSDPFENIDNEMYLEKIKKFFYKYKIIIMVITIAFILSALGLTVLNNYKNKEIDKVSNYYIKILSIIESDPNRAKSELKKLAKLKNKDYRNLSNFLLFKLQFQNNELEESLKTLGDIEENSKSNSYLARIIKYYYSQVFMELNNKKNFEIYTNELLSYGGMWSLLAHELRGHLQFANKDYENALKNFNKIIQNQQSTVSIRNRAQEMIDNINLYYDKNN
tara:strand:- start:412 stop:1071 length:660 start_codon:yes stop_codon:yes gene_type:complete